MSEEARIETADSTKTAAESVKKVTHFQFYSSGSRRLDELLGGGFRAGTLTELFGRSNSCKSQLAMQATLIAAKSGDNSLYIDTEGSFRPERLEQMARARGWNSGDLMERILYVRSDSASEQMEAVRQMQGRKATASSKLVVIDTLTRNFSVELPGSTNIPNRQAAIDIHLSEIARDAYLNERAYILTNRVTFGPDRDVGIGGKTVEQMVTSSVLLEREGVKVKATGIGGGLTAQMEISELGVV